MNQVRILHRPILVSFALVLAFGLGVGEGIAQTPDKKDKGIPYRPILPRDRSVGDDPLEPLKPDQITPVEKPQAPKKTTKSDKPPRKILPPIKSLRSVHDEQYANKPYMNGLSEIYLGSGQIKHRPDIKPVSESTKALHMENARLQEDKKVNDKMNSVRKPESGTGFRGNTTRGFKKAHD